MENIINWLEHWGMIGLFIGNILDSSFVGLCGTMDVLLVSLCMDQDLSKVIFNCLSSTSGSVTGMVIFYIVLRKGRDTFLKKYLENNTLSPLKKFVEKYELPLVILVCIAPPPFPFKIFMISAILFSQNFFCFLAGVITGRGFRFFFEGIAVWHYGDTLKEHYPLVIAVMFVMLISSYMVKRKLKSYKETA